MEFLLSQNNLWILLIALVSGAMLLWPSLARGRPGNRIILADAIQQVNRQNGIFVDIRPPDQYKAGHIPQSRNISIDTLEAHTGTLPKNRPIVLVDAHGRGGGRAAELLRKHGFDQVSCLEGGLASWNEAGMPLKKS